jgi:hypothetical protein
MRLSSLPSPTSVGLGRLTFTVALAVAGLTAAGCSNGSRFAGPSWNLTGGKETLPVPSQPVYAPPVKPSAMAPREPQPAVVYRGGRDPLTGRAPAWRGSQQTVEQVPLRASGEPHSVPMPDPRAPAAQTPLARPARPGTVEVRPGQTLAIIASEHRVSIASLMTANQLRDPYVIPGQTLIVPPR